MPQIRNAAIALAASGLATPALALQTRAGEVIELTGQVPIKGFRLDKPYPGNWDSPDKQSGWSLQLNITNNAFDGTSDRFVASLVPPKAGSEGAVVNKDGSWAVSEEAGKSWNLLTLGLNIVDFPQNSEPNDQENGDCPESVFSEKCRKDLRQYIKDMLKVPLPNAGTDEPLYASIVLPPSCEPYNESHLEVISTTSLETFNKTSSFAWSYNKGVGAFDDFSKKTWPFVLIWGPSNAEQEMKDDHVQFQCVKADKTVGSSTPSGSANNTTTTTTGGAGAATSPPLVAGASRIGGFAAAVCAAALTLGLSLAI